MARIRRSQTVARPNLTNDEWLALDKAARTGDQAALAVLEDVQEEAGYPREAALHVTGYAKNLSKKEFLQKHGSGSYRAGSTDKWEVTTWDGKHLGYGQASCRPYHRGVFSREQCSFWFKIDGKWYHGRGGGDGMVVNLRPEKPKKKYKKRRLY